MRKKRLTSRRFLRALRPRTPQEPWPEAQIVRDEVQEFVLKLQRRYPFRFAKGSRDLLDEQNRWIQEKLVTHLLFGAVAELSGMPGDVIDKAWRLAGALSRTIGKGGEHYRPCPFSPEEKKLAEEIGEKNFDLMLEKAETLSRSMNFKLGPVNPAEHGIAWCFRYLRQLLVASRWESAFASR